MVRFITYVMSLLLLLTTVLSPAAAIANVIFEGYYKISLSNVHSGYAIQRYELNPKNKQFKSTYYIYVRTSPDGKKSSSESLVAVSDDGFKPISYQYTSLSGGKPITIDASFPNNKVVANIREGDQKGTRTHTLPKGTFLSTMLLYMVLKKGLKKGAAYSFNAVAEEDGQVHPGTLQVAREEVYQGNKVFRLKYNFKNVPAEAVVAHNGNVLAAFAPAQQIKQELVLSASEARLNFPFPEKSIKRLFGTIPTGQVNYLAEKNRNKNKTKNKKKSQ